MNAHNPTSVSPACIALVKVHEGFKARPYLCPAGKLTVGYGHRLYSDAEAKRHGFVNEEQATALLIRDLAHVALDLGSILQVQVNQAQFDALCSFVFNIGQRHYAQSTLRQKLEASDFDGAADELPRWVYGRVRGVKTQLPGLVKRRAEERALFLTL